MNVIMAYGKKLEGETVEVSIPLSTANIYENHYDAPKRKIFYFALNNENGLVLVERPCGHPGDTQNGDFKLIKDTEFVFGATVEYTCRTG